MPPVTPSPHRFLPGRRRQQSPPRSTKPARSSVLAPSEAIPRQQLRTPAQQNNATPQQQIIPPLANTSARSGESLQFAQTPRFSLGRSPQIQSLTSRSPQKPSLAQALRRSREDVEESQAVDQDEEEMLDVDEPSDVLLTTEGTQEQQTYRTQEWVNELPYSPKRRKLEYEESQARSVFKHPTTPASHYTSAAQNFIRAGSVASSVASNETTASRRPPFLRPSLAAQEHSEPLPEAFSPHRRGEKFVPGGMAATLQQWVIETGQAAAQSRRGQGYLGGEDYVWRLEVSSVSGSSPILVKGCRWDEEELRVMLIVNAKRGFVDVLPGSVVGIRAPTWEVELEGEMWNVGVDWKVA